MLVELEIKNFALVDHLVLEFGQGLTVLTGETGAGKSIILDSLGFLLGLSKGESSSECRVAGRFLPNRRVCEFLEQQGLPADEEDLLIARERRGSGRTVSRLNGSLVSVAQLRELAGLLVDFHGQHQSYGLTRPATHLPMLDRIAGEQHASELEKYSALYQSYLGLQREIEELQTAERDRLREIEWLKLELEDIEKIEPRPGEDLELENEIRRRAASEELAQGAGSAVSLLGGEGGAVDSLNAALASLRSIERFDENLRSPVDRLESAEIEVSELLRELRDYSDEIEHDSSGLDKLQQRAEQLKALCRKYGPTLEDVLEHSALSARKLQRLENSDVLLSECKEKFQKLGRKLSDSAKKLSRGRRKAAAELGKELVTELSQLAMPKVVFQVEFQPLEEFSPVGMERAQFLFSPIPGRPPSPLAETASGGELSRVMLALVSVLSRFQKQPTLIFDEIDVGLGGRTAEAVATKLRRLAEKVQVLCVTHLPVVAAAGSGHLVVEKESGLDRTSVSVAEVVSEERVAEVARMLSGGASQARARELATELLGRWKEGLARGRSGPVRA